MMPKRPRIVKGLLQVGIGGGGCGETRYSFDRHGNEIPPVVIATEGNAPIVTEGGIEIEQEIN